MNTEIYYKLSEILEATEPFARIKELEHIMRTFAYQDTDVPYEKITEVSHGNFHAAMSRITVNPHMTIQSIVRKFQKLGYQTVKKTKN